MPQTDAGMRVVFLGTAEFACPSLSALADDPSLDVVAVVTQPDRPSGRKLKLQPSPVKLLAQELGLLVEQPLKARDPEFLELFRSWQPDLCVVAAYGQILPLRLLETPVHHSLNVHGSLLPRHRGAAPVHWAMLDGDAETGVTIMKMDAGLDTGPMVSHCRTPILEEDTFQSLHDRLAQEGAELLVRTIPDYVAGRLAPVPQDASLSTYARKIEKSDGWLDWRLPASVLGRKIQALNPRPGTFTWLPDGRRMKVLKARIHSDSISEGTRPGTVLQADASGCRIATGQGILEPLILQRDGGNPNPVASFLNGFSLQVGEILASEEFDGVATSHSTGQNAPSRDESRA